MVLLRSWRRKPKIPTILMTLGATGQFSTTSTEACLNIAIVSGTTRTEGPPSPILGPRVNLFLASELRQRGHEVTIIDPREVNLPLLQKPHFSYPKKDIPPELDAIHQVFTNADVYVMATPEYNRSPSPALMNVLNHFGSSTFSFKPSCIVSYSAGQWGGAFAAQALRPLLSELGCLPVSAMIHIPKVQEVLAEDGVVLGEDEAKQRWSKYVGRSFAQLEWWGTAAKEYKKEVNPFKESPAFQKTPSQRNAP